MAVSDALSENFLDVDVEMDVSNGKLMAYLAAHGDVLSKRYEDDRAFIHCRISSSTWPRPSSGMIRAS